jgi:hypothetical protein
MEQSLDIPALAGNPIGHFAFYGFRVFSSVAIDCFHEETHK